MATRKAAGLAAGQAPIRITQEGSDLVLRIDLQHGGIESSTGKTYVVAKTQGGFLPRETDYGVVSVNCVVTRPKSA